MRLMQNKEPIKDGAPVLYTDKKDGVNPAYNIRTDRFEIATEAMDVVHRSKEAKRDEIVKPKKETKETKEAKIVEISEAESTPGTAENTQIK